MPQRIAIYVFDDVEVLDFAGPYEVFTTAARVHARRSGNTAALFEVFTVAHRAGTVRARAGLPVVPDYIFGTHPDIDVLIIPGGVIDAQMTETAVTTWIAATAARTSLTASVCTGAFLLAQAGLFDGHPATTHWEDIADLRARFPSLQVQEGVRWVDNGSVVSSAGISAGIDMSLHLVERCAGRELALATAKQLEFDWTENRPLPLDTGA